MRIPRIEVRIETLVSLRLIPATRISREVHLNEMPSVRPVYKLALCKLALYKLGNSDRADRIL